MPVMSQQASAAVPQASMPYGAVSAPAFAAPSMAPHPFANGMCAPAAPAAAASVGLPTSMPTAVRFIDTVYIAEYLLQHSLKKPWRCMY